MGVIRKFYVGFEINNPGKLNKITGQPRYVPWFNTKKSGGNIVPESENDEIYDAEDLHIFKHDKDNIERGAYLPYSKEQFDALISIISHLDQTIPSFRLDRVFGHDEVSPGRKYDPGGAMAHDGAKMTMPQFRDHLKSVLG